MRENAPVGEIINLSPPGGGAANIINGGAPPAKTAYEEARNTRGAAKIVGDPRVRGVKPPRGAKTGVQQGPRDARGKLGGVTRAPQKRLAALVGVERDTPG